MPVRSPRRTDVLPTPHDRPDLVGRLTGLPSGRLSKYAVLLGVVGLLFLALPLAGQVGDVEDNGPTSNLPRDAESTLVEQRLPAFDADGVLPGVVVYARDGGLTAADRAAIKTDRAALADVVLDARVSAPRFSDDGEAASLVFSMDSLPDDWFDDFEEVRERTDEGAPEGLDVLVTGPSATVYDSVSVFDGLDTRILGATVLVVALLLLITYRSPVLWLLPLLAISVGAVVAESVIYLLGEHVGLPVDGQSGGILPILVFGVGTDYALLLIARYREELHRHDDRHLAMAVALRRAGPAIVASAGTVVLGLSCLTLADLNSTRSLGAVGAVGVACAAAALLVVLPMLMAVCGRWVFWPFVPRVTASHDQKPATAPRGWGGVVRVVTGAPRVVWVVTASALAGLALVSFTVDVGTTGMAFRTAPDSVAGQKVLAAHFSAGTAAPIEVVADAAVSDQAAAIIEDAPGVDTVSDAVASPDRARVLLHAVLDDAPETTEAEQTVTDLRRRLDSLAGGTALVGGPTAKQLDVGETSAHDVRVIIPAVLGVVLLVLVLLLRALVGPLVLLASVVLSYGAAFGAGGLVMAASGFDAVDVSLPLLAFVFLVALGVDYTIFLASRMREEVAASGHHIGVVRGLVTTGGVITSAGLVLAATFSVLIVLPIVFMIGLGVVVALGICLDTFVVRTLLVPALALDIGPWFWWPGRLARSAPGESTR